MSMTDGVLYPMDPPEGTERDPNQSPDAAVLTVITGVTFALATISMGVRLWARIAMIKKVAFDDCGFDIIERDGRILLIQWLQV